MDAGFGPRSNDWLGKLHLLRAQLHLAMSETDSVQEYGGVSLSRSPPKPGGLERVPSSTPTKWAHDQPRAAHDLDALTEESYGTNDNEEAEAGASRQFRHSKLSRISLDRLHLLQSPATKPDRSSSRLQPLNGFSNSRYGLKKAAQAASTSSSTLVDELGGQQHSGPDHFSKPKEAGSLSLRPRAMPSVSSLRHSVNDDPLLGGPYDGLDHSGDLSASARISQAFDRILRGSAATSPPKVSTPGVREAPLRDSRSRTSSAEFNERASTRLRDYYADTEDVSPGSKEDHQQGEKPSDEPEQPEPQPEQNSGTPARTRLWRSRSSHLLDSPMTPHLPGFLQQTPARPNSAPTSSTPKEPPPSQSQIKTPKFPGAYQHTTTPAPPSFATPYTRKTKGKAKEQTSPGKSRTSQLSRVRFNQEDSSQDSAEGAEEGEAQQPVPGPSKFSVTSKQETALLESEDDQEEDEIPEKAKSESSEEDVPRTKCVRSQHSRRKLVLIRLVQYAA